ncbi:transcription elongation factor GreA [Dehalobacterium formicoaceticum]|uniref:Transcription elongation factor GreA n=1 Tax=Dehalobacterium formicoaceticum TaxID=51515 RepID=A0ABT1Y332_9FIRM|nr:transcription elongation factor GreA [Dehalobacterium formicoaceticum]MCR6545284.1 transcription elongation factor GreA [Dehalobacterium formicoaceticum]
MPNKEVILTVEGLKKLEDELEQLKSVRRREVALRIKQAIEFGDISENSEYEDAKNEQAFIEGTIMNLEKKLRNARVIDANDVDVATVSVGATVQIEEVDSGDKLEYSIVGSVEADPVKNKISNESPVGKALLGHSVGDIVAIDVPIGVIKYRVLNISK